MKISRALKAFSFSMLYLLILIGFSHKDGLFGGSRGVEQVANEVDIQTPGLIRLVQARVVTNDTIGAVDHDSVTEKPIPPEPDLLNLYLQELWDDFASGRARDRLPTFFENMPKGFCQGAQGLIDSIKTAVSGWKNMSTDQLARLPDAIKYQYESILKMANEYAMAARDDDQKFAAMTGRLAGNAEFMAIMGKVQGELTKCTVQRLTARAPVKAPATTTKPRTWKDFLNKAEELKKAESTPVESEEILQRRADNQKLLESEQFRQDLKKVGITDEQIEWMRGKKCPLGFKDPVQFEKFKLELRETLAKAGLNDAQVEVKGTSTAFYSENPKKPLGHHFDANPAEPGDIDMGIASKQIVERMKAAGKEPHPKMPHIYKTKDLLEVFPELKALSDRWKAALGRDVNFVGSTGENFPPPGPADYRFSQAGETSCPGTIKPPEPLSTQGAPSPPGTPGQQAMPTPGEPSTPSPLTIGLGSGLTTPPDAPGGNPGGDQVKKDTVHKQSSQDKLTTREKKNRTGVHRTKSAGKVRTASKRTDAKPSEMRTGRMDSPVARPSTTSVTRALESQGAEALATKPVMEGQTKPSSGKGLAGQPGTKSLGRESQNKNGQKLSSGGNETAKNENASSGARMGGKEQRDADRPRSRVSGHSTKSMRHSR
jgi:hypothetical protein